MLYYKAKNYYTKEKPWVLTIHESASKSTFHTQDFYEFTIIYSDNIEYYLNGNRVLLASGNLIFSCAGDEHLLNATDDKPIKFTTLSFPEEILEEALEFLKARDFFIAIKNKLNLIKLSPVETQNLVGIIKKITNVEHSDPQEKLYYVRSVIIQLFIAFLLNRKEGIPEAPHWLLETISWVKQDKNFSFSLAEIAKHSGKSKEHFCRCMVKYTNTTAMEYINKVRLEYIATILEYGDMPITELYLSAGFYSSAYFNKLFKKRYGITPTAYRREYNKAMSI